MGDTLSPWGPALPVGALPLHRAITFLGIPKRPSPGSVWDLAPLLFAALCQEVALGGHSYSRTLPGLDTRVSRVFLPLGLPVLPVWPLPGCLSLPAAGGQSCVHGQALQAARAGGEAGLGWEQRSQAGARAMRVHRVRSNVCQSFSAFSPGNQLNRQARSGARPRCGTGGEAAVSPGEEGTGRTCRAPARTGLCCSTCQPGPAVSSSWRGAGHQEMDPRAGERLAFFSPYGAQVGMFYGTGSGLVMFPSLLLSVELGLGW